MALDIFLYAFAAILVLILATIYFKLIRPQKQIYDKIRAQGIGCEPFVPLFGQMAEVKKYHDLYGSIFYHEMLSKKHGYTYMIGFGPHPRLVISDPDLLADIFTRANVPYIVRPDEFRAEFVPLVGYHNLLVAMGREHERARRMINPAFYHNNLKSMVAIIADRTARAIESTLERSVSADNQANPVNMQIVFNMLTLSVIASSAFGADLETNHIAKDVLCRVLIEVVDATHYRSLRMLNQIPVLASLPFGRKNVIDEGMRKVGAFVDQIISDRRNDRSKSMRDGTDLLDLLLTAVDEEDKPFTNQAIKDESLTFVLAGSETTGNLMVWILYVLMTNESVLQACREEVDRVLPKDTVVTNDHLADLPICEAIVNEGLRLYPPVPYIGRDCTREQTIGTERPLRLPAGMKMIIDTYILHRREDLWPRPLEFDYTRWMRDPKTGLKPKLAHPFAYLPFAAGPRNCIGQNFAVLEAKIILAMLVQRCNFEMVPGQKIVPVVKVTMRPRDGLWAKITRRQV